MPRKVTPPAGSLVWVEWHDSVNRGPKWLSFGELAADPSPCVCRSVGWVVAANAACLVLAAHFAFELGDEGRTLSDSVGCGDMTIPSGCVLRIVRLADPGKRRKGQAVPKAR